MNTFLRCSFGGLFAACIIFTSGYALSSVEGSRSHAVLFLVLAVLLLVAALRTDIANIFSSNAALSLLSAFLIVPLLSIVANPSQANLVASAKFWIITVCAFLSSRLVSQQSFYRAYYRIAVFFGLVSLVAYGLTNGLGIALPLPRFQNINEMPYLNGFIVFVYDNHLSFRNTGPFWEPGIFGTYLAIAVFIGLSDPNRETSRFGIAVLSICLVTTMSAASALFGALLVAYWLTLKSRGTLDKVFLCLGGVVVLVVFAVNFGSIVIALSEVLPAIFSKFTRLEALSISERIDSPMTCLALFIENPWFGLGLGDSIEVYSSRTDAPLTSTVFFYLAAFGMFGAVFPIAWFFGICRQVCVGWQSKIVLTVFVLAFLNKEPHYYFTLTYLILFYLVGYDGPMSRNSHISSKAQRLCGKAVT